MSTAQHPSQSLHSPTKIHPPKRKLYRGMAAILRDASKSSENISQGKTRNQSKIPIRSKTTNSNPGEESDSELIQDNDEADYNLINYDAMFTSDQSSEDEADAQRVSPSAPLTPPELALMFSESETEMEPETSIPTTLPVPKTTTRQLTPNQRERKGDDQTPNTENAQTAQPNILDEVKKLTQVSQRVAQQLSRLEDLDQKVSEAIDKTLDQRLQSRVEQAISTSMKEINTSPSQVSSLVKEAVAAEFEKGMNESYFERVNEKLLENIKTGITDPMEAKIQQIDASLESTKEDLLNVEKDLKQKYINNATSIVQVNNEIKKHKESITHLTRDVTTLQQAKTRTHSEGEIQKLEMMMDDLEQRAKAQNIFLTGPAVPQEVTEIIPALNDLLSLTLSTHDVSQIIPIKNKPQNKEQNETGTQDDNQTDHSEQTTGKKTNPKKTPPSAVLAYKIIFTDVATQKKVMKQKTKLQGKKLWINADLTKKRYSIYQEATKLKKDGKIARVWADNGRVLCKVKADSPVTQFDPKDYDQD